MRVLLAFFVVLLPIAGGFWSFAQADGVHVRNTTDLSDLAKQNSVAVVVEVLRVRPVWKRARYQRNNRYVSAWRLRVRPTRVIAGNVEQLKKAVWVQRRTNSVPGRRVMIHDLYRPTQSALSSAKKGSKLVLFLGSWGSLEREDLMLSEVDLWTPAFESEVEKAYVAMKAEKLAAPRRGMHCTVPYTFHLGGECLEITALAKALPCPALSEQVSKIHGLRAVAHCKTKDGVQGMSRIWASSGEQILKVRFEKGKPHGMSELFWDDGTRKQTGSNVHGLRHGTWLHYKPDGSEIGSFVLDHGTGVFKKWDREGRLQAEQTHRAGQIHGSSVSYQANGWRTHSSYRQDVLWGREVLYHKDSVARVDCYRKGRRIWSVKDRTKLQHALKRRCSVPPL